MNILRIRNRGKRIKARDKHLVVKSIFSSLFFIVIILFSILNIRFITRVLKTKNIEVDDITSTYFITTFVVSILIWCILFVVYLRFKQDHFKTLFHKQKIAKMILENRWYESSTTSSSRNKEKITFFPKIYYKLEKGIVRIEVQITLGRYQEQLLHLERKLETGLYCELIDKELKDSYVVYSLLYDTICNRISINDVKVNNGSMRLMNNVIWEYDELPHMLIAGGTGGGKTYFILTLINSIASTDSNIYILDPKNSDLADLSRVLPNVHYKKEAMIECLNNFYDDMMLRNELMKRMQGYKTGKNYAYLGMPANFLIFDEYVAFMDSLGKQSSEVMSKLKQIVMLGRQSGYFLILACQRPDAKYLGDGIRDQFNIRIALGRMSELGYTMMFGETNKDFFQKKIRGRGYIDVGTSVISEFYTPLVPKEYDFLEKIGKAYKSRLEASAVRSEKHDGSEASDSEA